MASVLSDIMGKKPAAKKPEEDKKKEQPQAAVSGQTNEPKAAAAESDLSGNFVSVEDNADNSEKSAPAEDNADKSEEPVSAEHNADKSEKSVSAEHNADKSEKSVSAEHNADNSEKPVSAEHNAGKSEESVYTEHNSFDFGKLKKAAREVADIDKVKGFAEKAAGKFAEASDKLRQKPESGSAKKPEAVSESGSAAYDKPAKRKMMDRFLDDPLADLPERGMLSDPGEEYGTRKIKEDSDIPAPPTKRREEPAEKKQAIPEAKKAAPGYHPADIPKPDILRADESKPVILLDIILDNTISMSEYYPYIYPKLLRLVDDLVQAACKKADSADTDSGKLRFGLSFVRDRNDDLEEYVKTFDGRNFISDPVLFADALAEVEFYKGAADGREDINGALRLSLEKLWKEAWNIAQQSPEKYSGIENAARCAVLLISDSLPAAVEGEEGAELAPDYAHFIGLEAARLYVYDNEEYVPGLNCKEYSVSTLAQLLASPEEETIMDLKWVR